MIKLATMWKLAPFLLSSSWHGTSFTSSLSELSDVAVADQVCLVSVEIVRLLLLSWLWLIKHWLLWLLLS